MGTLAVGIYIFQSYFLALISFLKLNHVFANSQFALSHSTVFIYKIWFIAIAVSIILANIFDNISTLVAGVLVVICLFLVIGLFLSTITLFVKKLIAVYKFKKNDTGSSFMYVATKLSVLSITSMTITLLEPLIVASILITRPDVAIGTAAFIFNTLLDSYTNLWCVLLSYNGWDDTYDKLCHCIHSRCQFILYKCSRRDEVILTMTVTNSKESKTEMSGNTNIETQDNAKQSDISIKIPDTSIDVKEQSK
eukprot:158664_1